MHTGNTWWVSHVSNICGPSSTLTNVTPRCWYCFWGPSLTSWSRNCIVKGFPVGWLETQAACSHGKPMRTVSQDHFWLIWSKSNPGWTLRCNSQFSKKRFLQELSEKKPLLAATAPERQRLLWYLWKSGVSACAETATTSLSTMLMLIRCINTLGHWGKTETLSLSPGKQPSQLTSSTLGFKKPSYFSNSCIC